MDYGFSIVLLMSSYRTFLDKRFCISYRQSEVTLNEILQEFVNDKLLRPNVVHKLLTTAVP